MLAFAGVVFISGMFLASPITSYLTMTNKKPEVMMSTTTSVKTASQVAKEHYIAQYEESKQNIYNLVDEHIKSVAPKSKVSAEVIVENCIKYDIDIKLVLAQAQQESHFGTTGIAKKTNSIFNVHAYDGRSAGQMINAGHGFNHPDESVEPFMQLLKRRYLPNKTEQQLLRNYVDVYGKRYASAENYEYKLKNIYNQIPNEIYDYMDEYKNYKNIMCAYEFIG